MIKEKYLLDANVFVTPYQNYYPFDFTPGFWNQLSPKLDICKPVRHTAIRH